MARIPRDVVDTVRDRSDVVEVIGRHVKLTRRGGNFVGLCPFHQEKSPSFNVNPAKGIFHCFGCNAGGDVFKFLMMIEGLSFVEAVKELAGPAGVTIEERELTPAERQNLKKRATLYDVLEAAAAFYESVLWTSADGAKGRAYLEKRALSKEVARAARVGFAPEGWSKLLDHLRRQGFAPDQVHEAGLAKERPAREDRPPGFYDAMRDRVVFPIRDERGRVIAFGGRLLEGDGPKYLNSPETRLYEKSKTLYGLDRARQAIQRLDRVLVVEGYFDVLTMHQHGFEETVATCGTALTPEHLQKLRRLTTNICVLTDADEAGQRAAERVLPLFIEVGLTPWRLEIPGAKDPDELLRTEGPAAMTAAIDARQWLPEWVVQRRLLAYSRPSAMGPVVDGNTSERVIQEMAPLLARVPDAMVSRIAALLKVDERSFRERLAKLPPTPSHADAQGTPPPEPPSWKPAREVVHLLWLLVHRYDLVADLVAQADPLVLEGHGPIRPAVARLLSGEPVAAVLDDTHDAAVGRTLSAVVARDRLYAEDEAAIAVCAVLERLGKPLRVTRLEALTREVDDALRHNDFERYRTAAAERKRVQENETRLLRAISARDTASCAPLLATAAGSPVSRDFT